MTSATAVKFLIKKCTFVLKESKLGKKLVIVHGRIIKVLQSSDD